MGKKLKNPTKAREVAFPVAVQAQMVRAKPDMAVPKREKTWPTQMMRKFAIPCGLFIMPSS